MLTLNEVTDYLTEVLEMKNIERLLNYEKKQDIIEKIMDVYREKEPFQNISLLSVDPQNRRRPTWNEIKADMFLKKGGICYSHHIFLFALFKGLDFNVSLANGGVSGPNNHLVLLFRDVYVDGDLFLLEAAIGHPSFHLISLDFEKESPNYYDSFLEYKYIKHGGRIMRMHRRGDARNQNVKDRDINIEGWTRFYDFEIKETKDITDFDASFDVVYTDQQATHFHSNFHFIIFKNRKTFIIHNNTILIENDNSELEKRVEETDEELMTYLQTLTTSFEPPVVLSAMKNYKQTKLETAEVF